MTVRHFISIPFGLLGFLFLTVGAVLLKVADAVSGKRA